MKIKCTFVPGIITFLMSVRVTVGALLGATAFGVSPLALPWGSGAWYVQSIDQRRVGKAGNTR